MSSHAATILSSAKPFLRNLVTYDGFVTASSAILPFLRKLYIYQDIDDLVDSVPNSQLEEHFGGLIPEDITQLAPFWRGVLGDDAENIVQSMSYAYGHKNVGETCKLFNLAGLLFKDLQDHAQEALKSEKKRDYEGRVEHYQAVAKNSQLTTHLMRNLTVDSELAYLNSFFTDGGLIGTVNLETGQLAITEATIPLADFSIAATTGAVLALAPKGLVEKQCKRARSLDDLWQIIENHEITGVPGQVGNDLRDVFKDLSSYKSFKGLHVATNAVLVRHIVLNPDADLMDIPVLKEGEQLTDGHPLYQAYLDVCSEYTLKPHPERFSFEEEGTEKARLGLSGIAAVGALEKWLNDAVDPRVQLGRFQNLLSQRNR